MTVKILINKLTIRLSKKISEKKHMKVFELSDNQTHQNALLATVETEHLSLK